MSYCSLGRLGPGKTAKYVVKYEKYCERNEPSGVFRFKEKIEGTANDLGRLRIRLVYIQRRGTKYPPPNPKDFFLRTC